MEVITLTDNRNILMVMWLLRQQKCFIFRDYNMVALTAGIFLQFCGWMGWECHKDADWFTIWVFSVPHVLDLGTQKCWFDLFSAIEKLPLNVPRGTVLHGGPICLPFYFKIFESMILLHCKYNKLAITLALLCMYGIFDAVNSVRLIIISANTLFTCLGLISE